MELRKETVVPVIVGASSLIVGMGIGYVLGKLRNKRPYFGNAPSEVEEQPSGDSDSATATEVRYAGEVDSARKDSEAEQSQPSLPFGETVIVVEETETEITIMERPAGERYNYRGEDYWDYNEEAQNRTPNRPYIIHVQEYNNEEMDYPHEELKYYVKDDVLLLARDNSVLFNRSDYGLLLFGHGSEDPNLVYIRNEKLGCEYEVYRLDEHYGVEILGYDEEITHSRGHKPKKGKQHPKFRQE